MDGEVEPQDKGECPICVVVYEGNNINSSEEGTPKPETPAKLSAK